MGYDTVAAIATPLGSGGIGIIRISGKEALGITQAIFRPSCRKIFDPYPSHRFFHGWIRDPKSGMILDEVLMVYMQAPRSYTREDVAEIH
ncbi:MAG: tRNA uridine-5-carboxymethylaminomethyl(34) synthesis GTPase MnmE, partial [Desulfobacterales bacterium CG23_combo_of_CG06-09_8_20_14_all_52_9]